MTREEHLAWCKQRAHAYLDHGYIKNAVASMMSDMQKHEETKLSLWSPLSVLGIFAAMSNNYEEARRYIDDFN
jgi:hypothetical protein